MPAQDRAQNPTHSARRKRAWRVSCVGLVLIVSSQLALAAAAKAPEGALARQDLEVIECLLPGQVRQLGNTTYLTQRRPTRTTAADCRLRGGEYVAFDRADLKSSLKVWMQAAEGGDAEAQTNVGEIYERGLGDAPNYEAAAIWYQKAADQGFSRAQFNLGTLYEQGHGVETDKLKALDLYRQAWGMPEGAIVYKQAANDEIASLRAELQKQIEDKDEQIKALGQQVDQLKAQLGKQTGNSAELTKQAETLGRLVASLRADRDSSQTKLNGLPAVTATAATRNPGERDSTPLMDPTAFQRYVRGLDFGRYYAVIIGNQNYKVLESLQTPKTDAERAAQLLKDKYGFTVQIVEDASDIAMLRALNDLSKIVRDNDNVLIYYAGHGTRLKSVRGEDGYWLPVNADRPPDDTFWISNEQISAQLGRLKAKRVLVVADSCYAGLLSSDPGVNVFGTETQSSVDYLKYKLPKRARLLLSSGGDEPVLDQGGQGNSVFARAFLDVLQANDGVLSSPALFARLQERVRTAAARSNFKQVPEFKSIKSAGHEVGDFFFLPKRIG
jgi:hypothetical protein